MLCAHIKGLSGQTDSSSAVLRESDLGCSQTLCGLGVWSAADGQGGGRWSSCAYICECVLTCLLYQSQVQAFCSHSTTRKAAP